VSLDGRQDFPAWLAAAVRVLLENDELDDIELECGGGDIAVC
jgi:hypothetical protein